MSLSVMESPEWASSEWGKMWSKIPNLLPNAHQMSGRRGGVNWGDFYGLWIWSPQRLDKVHHSHHHHHHPFPFSLELEFGKFWHCGDFAVCWKDIVSLNNYYGRTREMASWAITVVSKKKLGYPSQDNHPFMTTNCFWAKETWPLAPPDPPLHVVRVLESGMSAQPGSDGYLDWWSILSYLLHQ